ncbi:MAG: apolipoprotein N-acyltransferase [Planctomycetota bacterium]
MAALVGMCWASLTAASLPPVSLWWLGLAAPFPIALIACQTTRPLAAGAGVALGTLPLWVYHHAWIAEVSVAGMVPLIGYLALWKAAVVFAIARVQRAFRFFGAAATVPTAWIGLEYVRGEIAFEGYPWFFAGHAMIESVAVASVASIGGVYLVSWLIVAISGVVLARRFGSAAHRRIALAVSVGVVGLVVASLPNRSTVPAERQVRIAALQTNVPQSNKAFPSRAQLVEDFRVLVDLAERAAASGAELLVTPETVLPTGLLDPAARAVIDEPFGAAMLEEQARIDVPMLVGCTTLEGVRFEGDRAVWEETFNSVYLLQDGEVSGPRYDKLRPTPFGETLPYIQSLPWLRDAVLTIGLGASGMEFGLARGETPTSFRIPIGPSRLTVTTPICFESSMAPTVRRLTNAARASGSPTDVFVVMTNDGWFGAFDAGRRMHLLQARWRCVEHRLPTVRSANTGISAVIDRYGRVVSSLDAQTPGVLLGDIEMAQTKTLYQTVGDRFGAGCAVVTLIGLVLSFVRRTSTMNRTAAKPSTLRDQGASE